MKTKRKHWVDYKDETGYGNWRIKFNDKLYFGFGIYTFNGQDVWLDKDCAMPSEKKMYKAYCKARGFTKKECEQ